MAIARDWKVQPSHRLLYRFIERLYVPKRGASRLSHTWGCDPLQFPGCSSLEFVDDVEMTRAFEAGESCAGPASKLLGLHGDVGSGDDRRVDLLAPFLVRNSVDDDLP